MGYFANNSTLHRSALAARAAILDLRLFHSRSWSPQMFLTFWTSSPKVFSKCHFLHFLNILAQFPKKLHVLKSAKLSDVLNFLSLKALCSYIVCSYKKNVYTYLLLLFDIFDLHSRFPQYQRLYWTQSCLIKRANTSALDLIAQANVFWITSLSTSWLDWDCRKRHFLYNRGKKRRSFLNYKSIFFLRRKIHEFFVSFTLAFGTF